MSDCIPRQPPNPPEREDPPRHYARIRGSRRSRFFQISDYRGIAWERIYSYQIRHAQIDGVWVLRCTLETDTEMIGLDEFETARFLGQAGLVAPPPIPPIPPE